MVCPANPSGVFPAASGIVRGVAPVGFRAFLPAPSRQLPAAFQRPSGSLPATFRQPSSVLPTALFRAFFPARVPAFSPAFRPCFGRPSFGALFHWPSRGAPASFCRFFRLPSAGVSGVASVGLRRVLPRSPPFLPACSVILLQRLPAFSAVLPPDFHVASARGFLDAFRRSSWGQLRFLRSFLPVLRPAFLRTSLRRFLPRSLPASARSLFRRPSGDLPKKVKKKNPPIF